ncbi:protein kinase 4 [Condylostylus longicornis]|uniref:protein kinase 4 n=1 Tax=Condylostylus longicornis TaxID=2530218 RepID=UPI00244DA122|nr:protein kinase 4 [Condylostylus longicornis]
MIVNSNMEQTHSDPPQPPPTLSQQTSQVSTTISQSVCNENFYLKRKHDDLNDSLDNCNYIQPKKRHIQQHEEPHEYTVADENYQNLANSQSQNDTIPTSTTIYGTTTNTTNNEHFDSSQWHNADLLELDQRYNSVTHCFEKITHPNDLHRNDEVIYQQQQPQQHQTHHQLQQQQQQPNQHHQQQEQLQHISHQLNQHDNINRQLQLQHQHDQERQHNLIPNSIALPIDNQINLNNQQQNIVEKSASKSSETEADFEDKNLSWLFNFRLDELPHLSPDVQNNPKAVASSLTNPINVSQPNKPINNNKAIQSKTGKKVDELIKELTAEITEDGDMIIGENIILENSPSPPKGPKKPPFTYTELIEYALEERGELTVSGIYQWISDRFPYYKSNDDRWKNSVRHNLSINPHFRKGLKAPQGAGHLWTIASRDSEENALAWEHKKQRLELFFKMEQLHNQRQQNSSSQEESNENNNQNYSTIDETAAAVQHITQQMQNDCNSPNDINMNQAALNNRISSTNSLTFENIIHGGDLKKSAGEILNGIRRTVEVQPINCRTISTYHDSMLDTEDYLNPINKDDDIITHEGGFRNEFYVTEIDPIELGINITNVEEEVLFSEDFNLNYFGITSANDIVA